MERVDEHVAREGDVEVTEPQELRPVTEHGVLKKERGVVQSYFNSYCLHPKITANRGENQSAA